jgi:hypothetical protein
MATNTVIRDFSYIRLKELEEDNESLLCRLRQSDEYKKKLGRGWFLAVRHRFSFSQQMLNAVYLNYTNGEGPMDIVWNALLVNFQDMGFRLKNIGGSLEKRLENMRMSSFC